MPDAAYHFPPTSNGGMRPHQVEGGNTNNRWWAWEQQPGRIAQGHRSGRACDWWANAGADFGDRAAAMNTAGTQALHRVEPGRDQTRHD